MHYQGLIKNQFKKKHRKKCTTEITNSYIVKIYTCNPWQADKSKCEKENSLQQWITWVMTESKPSRMRIMK